MHFGYCSTQSYSHDLKQKGQTISENSYKLSVQCLASLEIKQKYLPQEKLTKYESVVNQFDYIYISIRKRSPSDHRIVFISFVIGLSMIIEKSYFIDRNLKKFLKGR